MLKKTNVCIENYDGLVVVDGWTSDQHWNGWAIPLFDKVAADAIAEEIGLVYDKETDSYKETKKSAGDSDYLEEWTGGLNNELGVHVYAIGAMYWCWDTIAEDDIKEVIVKVIDRRTK